jgi:aspartyl/asparaginyl-tRNA synthetase
MTYYLKRIINEFFLKASFISALPNYLTDGTNTLGMNFFFKKYSKRQRILQQSQITFAVGH